MLKGVWNKLKDALSVNMYLRREYAADPDVKNLAEGFINNLERFERDDFTKASVYQSSHTMYQSPVLEDGGSSAASILPPS